MKSYYIDGLTNADLYKKFIHYMLKESEYFSLGYFRYVKNHPLKKSAKSIKEKLSPFQVMKTGNIETEHKPFTAGEDEYVYDIIFYRASLEAEEVLSAVTSIFDWNYPLNPQDLCFYKDTYMWFESIAEEEFISFCPNEKKEMEDIRNLGLTLELLDDMDE